MRNAERWYIENMFKDMKSNGFQLECTHITYLDRLDTLMAIIAIAYTQTTPITPLSRKQKVFYSFYENKIHTRLDINYPVIRIAGKYLRSFGFELAYRC